MSMSTRLVLRGLALVGLFAVLVGSTGCASSTSVEQLLAGIEGGPQPVFDRTAHVENVMGGREDSLFDDVGNTSSAQFQQAIKQSLEDANVFQHVGGASQADYKISAIIQKVTKPMVGLDMTVTMLVKYRIVDANQAMVWEDSIHSSYTEKMCSSCSNMVGAVRLNNAANGAVRANLAQFIEKIQTLDL